MVDEEDPYNLVSGGGLKIKGGKVKKKKKKKKGKVDDILEHANSSADKINAPSNLEDEDKNHSTSSSVKKTVAELAYEKSQEKRAAERILKKASKTHKQRVEELNEYLGDLSEHYDIQKVSWTK